MSSLPPSTRRRLVKLTVQPNSVWEGDRLSLNFEDPGGSAEDLEENRDCILWVDGVNGVVRAMDLIPSAAGQEAIVRTLLQAMEQPLDTPNQISRPARPKKIVVRSRELQFFLRGVLQELGIAVEYQPELPLIDEFFSGMQRMMMNRIPAVPAPYADALDDAVERLWDLAPWKYFFDYQILRLHFPQLEEQPEFYVSILGKAGMEFGILFYRSLESLKVFRQLVTSRSGSPQEAFFRQDCFYVTFNYPDESDLPRAPVSLDWEDLDVEFGSIHPLEGMQHHLGEEEAQIVLLSLEALLRFIKKNYAALKKTPLPSIENTIKLSLPKILPPELAKVTVEVRTEPELSEELLALNLEMEDDEDDEDFEDDDDFDDDDDDFDFDEEELIQAFLDRFGLRLMRQAIGDDLVPHGSIVSLGGLPWDMYHTLERLYRSQDPSKIKQRQGDSLPVLVIQTTRPKAKTILQNIKAAGGLAGIGFLQQEDTELGVLKLGNGSLECFGDYEVDDRVHSNARRNWDQRLANTDGMCGLLITHGVTGKRRGKPPAIDDIVMLLEAEALVNNNPFD